MADRIQIQLQLQSAAEKWGKAALTPSAEGFQIHLNAKEPLRSVQKAARSLDSLGITAVQLVGAHWTLELQWAFYQGFCTAKKHGGIEFCGDAATQQSLQQWRQRYNH